MPPHHVLAANRRGKSICTLELPMIGGVKERFKEIRPVEIDLVSSEQDEAIHATTPERGVSEHLERVLPFKSAVLEWDAMRSHDGQSQISSEQQDSSSSQNLPQEEAKMKSVLDEYDYLA